VSTHDSADSGVGFVNAHAHLELSHLAGRVPGGEGLPAWVGQLMAQPERPSVEVEEALAGALGAAVDHGTVGLIDVANTPRSTRALAEAGLSALVQRELLGWEPQRWSLALAGIDADGGPPGEPHVTVVPTAHSTYACSPELLATALRPGRVIRTVHCAEDAAELLFLREAAGPWAELLDTLGRPWRSRHLRARSPVALLAELEVLGPHLGLVHCVHTDGEDLDLIAESGATVVLCPRSNLHIGGRLPDVPAMVDRGIPLALGTDSLASCPDLDLRHEINTLSTAFPGLPTTLWLDAARAGAHLLPEPPPRSFDHV